MTFEPPSEIIAAGEGARTEFKRAMPSDLGREICALANAAGGVILLGVTDAGRVVEIGGHNRLKSEILSIARSADPPIKVEVESEDSVVSVRVPPQSAKPRPFGGRFFVRDGAPRSNCPATRFGSSSSPRGGSGSTRPLAGSSRYGPRKS